VEGARALRRSGAGTASTVWWRAAGVFVVASLVRLAAALHFLPSHGLLAAGGGDGAGYHHLAVAVSRGDLFSDHLYVSRPPGLPLVLGALYAAFGTSAKLFICLSVCSSAATAAVAVALAAELGFSAARATVVGLVLAFEPTSVFVGVIPYSDALFALCCALAFLFVIRLRRNISIGSLVALWASLLAAVLVKPSAQLLWVIPCIALIIWGRKGAAAVLSLAMIVPIGLWTLRNAVESDNPTYSSIVAYNLLVYRAVGVESHAEGKDPNKVVLPELEKELAARLGEPVRPYGSYAAPSSGAVQREMIGLALDTIRKYPIQYIGAIPVGVARLFFDPPELVPAGVWRKLATVLSVLLWVVAMVRWPFVRRRDPFFASFVIAVVAYFVITTVVTITAGFGGTRIVLPCIPLAVIIALWPRTTREPAAVAAA
jgi:hypothetical protein